MIGEIIAKQRESYLEKEEYIKALKRRIKGEAEENKKYRKAIQEVIDILTKVLNEETYAYGESTRYGLPENWKLKKEKDTHKERW